MYRRPRMPAGADVRRYGPFGDPAPDDAYGRVTDPERFLPVVEAGRALIAHFESEGMPTEYGVEPPGELARTQHNIVDVVRVAARGARLTFVFTAFPGVILDIDGERTAYPFCGCDHCDETALSTVERLENAVLPYASTVGAGSTR